MWTGEYVDVGSDEELHDLPDEAPVGGECAE